MMQKCLMLLSITSHATLQHISYYSPFYPYSSPHVSSMYLLCSSYRCPLLIRYLFGTCPLIYRTYTGHIPDIYRTSIGDTDLLYACSIGALYLICWNSSFDMLELFPCCIIEINCADKLFSFFCFDGFWKYI